jgi:glycosyltransferase involved in cell wall biosynthesis
VKILILTKRQYMGKDLLDDRFGRFWELPLELAQRGHEVQGISLSYRKRSQGSSTPSIDSGTGHVTWHSVNLLSGPWPGPRRYFRFARQIMRDFQPEIVWACSDAYHSILGHRLAKNSTAKLVVDLYDNFESYPATRIPGVLPLFKRAVKAADGVTCVSPQLANYVGERYRSRAPALVLENAIRSDLFRPMEREGCRKQLGLPPAAKIIGTAGSLYASRGIDTLYRGFEILAAENPSFHLALAGPRPSSGGIPRGEHTHDLGVLPLDKVSVFFNALDVAVVCNRDSSFGRYNFPQKAREIMACGTALVAAEVGSMKEILRDHRHCLFAPNDPASLAATVRMQLAKPTSLDHKVPSWSDLAAQLETFFLSIHRSRA